MTKLDQYLSNLLPYQDKSQPATEKDTKKTRWVYSKNQITTSQDSSIFSHRKIETILSKMTKDFAGFNSEQNHDISDVAAIQSKLETLKQIIKTNVEKYNQKHGMIYKFFSKLFYGDVTELQKQTFKQIDQFQNQIRRLATPLQAPQVQSPPVQPPQEVVLKQGESSQKKESDKPVSPPKTDVPSSQLEILDISITDEPNEDILKKALSIVHRFCKGVNEVLIQGHADFEIAEKLKATAKEARQLLKDKTISKGTQTALEAIEKQYDQFVKGIEVLSILREISRELRNPKMRESRYHKKMVPDSPTASRFLSFLGDSYSIDPSGNPYIQVGDTNVETLVNTYKSDKAEWQKQWSNIRKKIWNASVESHGFLQQKKIITFITGSKSSSIPSILKTHKLAPKLCSRPALVSTGQLFEHNIVPFSGELFEGISKKGINLTHLSGMRMAGLEACLDYAGNPQFTFNADKELAFIKGIHGEHEVFLQRLKVAVLRLLLSGEKREEYENLKQHLENQKKKHRPSSPINPKWESQAVLISQPLSPLLIETSDNLDKDGKPVTLRRGQVVGVPSADFNERYGIIEKVFPDGSCRVIVEQDFRITKEFPADKIIIVPDSVLDKEASALKETTSLNEAGNYNIWQILKEPQEALDEIIKLFDTIVPFNFSDQEKSLIKEPFPIVWAAINLDNVSILRNHNLLVKGEHAIKGPLELGKHVQVVFTAEQNVQKLREMVKEHDVQVLSFEAANYILGRDRQFYKDVYHNPLREDPFSL